MIELFRSLFLISVKQRNSRIGHKLSGSSRHVAPAWLLHISRLLELILELTLMGAKIRWPNYDIGDQAPLFPSPCLETRVCMQWYCRLREFLSSLRSARTHGPATEKFASR